MIADGAAFGALLESGVEVVLLAIGLVVDLIEALASQGAAARMTCETTAVEEVAQRLRGIRRLRHRLRAMTTRTCNIIRSLTFTHLQFFVVDKLKIIITISIYSFYNILIRVILFVDKLATVMLLWEGRVDS